MAIDGRLTEFLHNTIGCKTICLAHSCYCSLSSSLHRGLAHLRAPAPSTRGAQTFTRRCAVRQLRHQRDGDRCSCTASKPGGVPTVRTGIHGAAASAAVLSGRPRSVVDSGRNRPCHPHAVLARLYWRRVAGVLSWRKINFHFGSPHNDKCAYFPTATHPISDPGCGRPARGRSRPSGAAPGSRLSSEETRRGRQR